MSGFRCKSCGVWHDYFPSDWAFEVPDPWLRLTEDERERHGRLGTDYCIIDSKQFFIRGCAFVPIIETDRMFAWGLWVGVTERNYARIAEIGDAPGRENEPPFAARLANNLPSSVYPSTINLLCALQLSAVGLRPAITIRSDHPLAIEQRRGITTQRVEELAHLLGHKPGATT